MPSTPAAAPPIRRYRSPTNVSCSDSREWADAVCVPASLCLVIASVCVISIPTHLAGYGRAGRLKRYRAASLSVWAIAGSELIVAFALSAASSVVRLVPGRLVYDFDSLAALLGVIAVSAT